MAHPKVPSSKSFFDANAGLSVCTNYPEHISNQERGSATRWRRKVTLLSWAEMACLHSSAVPSIRWVIRPVRLIFGVFASMAGAGASEKRVTDEQQQRLDGRESPSDGSRVAPFLRASCELIQCPRRIVRAAHREGAQVNGKMGAAASSDRPWPRTPWGNI